METYFASAARTDHDTLTAEIESISKSPVLSGLLHSIGGLLAVLDANRQIVAVNDSLLTFLGMDDSAQVLGLRPGQALSCVHAHKAPAGCGTTKACSTCGAVLAIVSCLTEDEPVERLCALKGSKDGQLVELALKVQSQPIRVDGQRFVLLFIQDVSDDERRAALERTFFHDINNLLAILMGASEILLDDQPSDLSRTVFQVAQCLKNEVHLQACLAAGESGGYTPDWEPLDAQTILADLESFYATHAAARERHLQIVGVTEAIGFRSDRAALLRVLSNMVLNALEATEAGGTVRVWAVPKSGELCFSTWNRQPIDDAIKARIFQRNFSTKSESGRGLGTYSMKLFGEKLLQGRVDFTSSEAEGTIFSLTLPLTPAPAPPGGDH